MDFAVDVVRFEDFLKVMQANAFSSVNSKLHMDKLDAMIDDAAGGLSSDTIISHERRKLLLEHVVDRPAVRAWSIDQSDMANVAKSRNRRERIQVSKVETNHRKERFEASEIVWELKNALRNSRHAEEEARENFVRASSMCVSVLTPEDVLKPFEEMFSPELSQAIKHEEACLQDMQRMQKAQQFYSPVKQVLYTETQASAFSPGVDSQVKSRALNYILHDTIRHVVIFNLFVSRALFRVHLKGHQKTRNHTTNCNWPLHCVPLGMMCVLTSLLDMPRTRAREL
jgi:hypothetical protein